MKYDVFISYASEDKKDIAIPLANRLKEFGLTVWFDEFELTIGDSIRRSIDHGLSESQFGVVILSNNFFKKEWPKKELDGLFSRDDGKEKFILPIWHNINYFDVLNFSPILADKIAVTTDMGIDYVVNQIVKVVNQKSNSNIQHSKIDDIENLINEELSKIRRSMLSAKSYRDLSLTKYRLQKFLKRYPNYPEAQILYDELEEAILIESAPRDKREAPPPPCAMPFSSIRLILYAIVTFVGGGGIIYLLYRLIAWLIEITK
jgi:hypothetical protein